MSVYVDSPLYKFGNMTMCHMRADSINELLAMADTIGVKRKWLQTDRYGHHFDICKSKRKLAVEAGAIELDNREMGKILNEIRKGLR